MWPEKPGCHAACSPTASTGRWDARPRSTSPAGGSTWPPTNLRTRSRRIAEIAARLGFGSSSALSTAFARHVGCSPADYRSTQAAVCALGTVTGDASMLSTRR
ncbi:helix-turn-helix domain-containing protein [Lentzea sp. NPDC059081]|uniref:helix-turn-helix domain-containing protein n=1 Tax=Lentzea sp. NPDC059081 TaxID=3346719 RepID=UPI0036B6CBB9